jgi:O-antigen/teichoic acid export membrane protein
MRLPKSLRRAGWSGVDQGLFSITNVALSFAVAHEVSASSFGAFSIAYMVYILVINVARAIVSEPLIVRFAATSQSEIFDAAQDATGFALVFGIVVAVPCALAGFLLPGELGKGLIGLAIFLPGILLQDSYRFTFFAEGEPQRAALNDTFCAVVLFGGLGTLIAIGTQSVFIYLVTWGGGTTLAALFGMAQTRVLPRPGRWRLWFTENVHLATGFVTDYVLLIAASQIGSFAVGFVSGLNSLGGLRAANVLMGPVTTMIAAARVTVLPEAVRARAKSVQKFRSVILTISIGLGSLTAVIGGALCLLPDSAGHLILGQSWKLSHHLLPYVVLGTIAIGLNLGPLVGLRVLRAPRRLLSLSVASAERWWTVPWDRRSAMPAPTSSG